MTWVKWTWCSPRRSTASRDSWIRWGNTLERNIPSYAWCHFTGDMSNKPNKRNHIGCLAYTVGVLSLHEGGWAEFGILFKLCHSVIKYHNNIVTPYVETEFSIAPKLYIFYCFTNFPLAFTLMCSTCITGFYRSEFLNSYWTHSYPVILLSLLYWPPFSISLMHTHSFQTVSRLYCFMYFVWHLYPATCSLAGGGTDIRGSSDCCYQWKQDALSQPAGSV